MDLGALGYCSWCNQRAYHAVHEKNYLRRNVYTCTYCSNRLVQCRYCQNLARVGPKWADELCSEHDGSIASFDRLSLQLKEISEFQKIFERDQVNLSRVAKIGIGTLAGVGIFASAGVLAAPGLAAAIGTTGALGAAGTGTAIATLNGAALTSASLAAIGGGTMAAGTLFITAAGGMLGAYQGGAISNSYFGEVNGFRIRPIRSGESKSKHAVIVVNGFMSQGIDDTTDWDEHLVKHFSKNNCYHTDWESKNLHKLGVYVAKAPKTAGLEFARELAKRAAKKAPQKLGPLAAVSHLTDLIHNPWHVAMVKASMTGIMLADAIARTPGWRFTLAGHSLGARVIYYALEALSTRSKPAVENVYLLGGAVGGGAKDNKGWGLATRSVKGTIFNCYSAKDDVLKYLYQGANGYVSKPVGYGGIALQHDKIFDLDCSEIVGSHMAWKGQFGEILSHLKG